MIAEAKERDVYDEAVEYLTDHPEEIVASWTETNTHHAGCLFGFCTPDRKISETHGCLTQIKLVPHRTAWTPELTDRIRSDERIPDCATGINTDNLAVFAAWQRTIDKELGREPPLYSDGFWH